MFYPSLERQSLYRKRADGSDYSDYTVHRSSIEEDCKYRCVYCDITMMEIGHEGFHIDHFRPADVFPELRTAPSNLVLACPKCNILKSKDWPTECFDAHNEECGYIDPFEENRSDFFEVDEEGRLLERQPPGQYVVESLALNRFARVQVRRARILERVREQLRTRLSAALEVLDSYLAEGKDVTSILADIKRVNDAL